MPYSQGDTDAAVCGLGAWLGEEAKGFGLRLEERLRDADAIARLERWIEEEPSHRALWDALMESPVDGELESSADGGEDGSERRSAQRLRSGQGDEQEAVICGAQALALGHLLAYGGLLACWRLRETEGGGGLARKQRAVQGFWRRVWPALGGLFVALGDLLGEAVLSALWEGLSTRLGACALLGEEERGGEGGVRVEGKLRWSQGEGGEGSSLWELSALVQVFEWMLQASAPGQRAASGSYYTPPAAAAFVVRSVDTLLRSQLGLVDGLADTASWEEVVRRLGIELPEGVGPADPFVCLLDVAAGAGMFLLHAMAEIHATVYARWCETQGVEQGSGASCSDAQGAQACGRDASLPWPETWSVYVSTHLVRRLCGVELLGASWVCCGMTLRLCLEVTGVTLPAGQELRLWRANTLAQTPRGEVTVVLGNPPYAVLSQNVGRWPCPVHQRYKDLVRGERNLQPLSDDYIRFLAYAHRTLLVAGAGVSGLLTNHTYLRGRLHGGLRQAWREDFAGVWVLDLHGSALLAERTPTGARDENIFPIRQGVACAFCVRLGPQDASEGGLAHAELWGSREQKLGALATKHWDEVDWEALQGAGSTPFAPVQVPDETYMGFFPLAEAMTCKSTGFFTGCDRVLIAFCREEIQEVIEAFVSEQEEDEALFARLGIKASRDWPLQRRRATLQDEGLQPNHLQRVAYRPFDWRWTYMHGLLQRPRLRVMRQLQRPNLALLVTRTIKGEIPAHVFVSREPVEKIFLSAKTSNNAYVFVLYAYPDEPAVTLAQGDLFAPRPTANFSPAFIAGLAERLGLRWLPWGLGDLRETFGPEDVFHAIYASLHDRRYRRMYRAFLCQDFPRIPWPTSRVHFLQLAQLGADLVALHLMEEAYPAASWLKAQGSVSSVSTVSSVCSPQAALAPSPPSRWGGVSFVEGTERVVRSIGKKGRTLSHIEGAKGRLYINETAYFNAVPLQVWEFRVGGHQVCARWLTERRKAGRALTDAEIAHFCQMCGAISETIARMDTLEGLSFGHE